VVDAHLLDKHIFRVENEPNKKEINYISDKSPHKIRHHQLLELLLDKFLGITCHRFVEIACLEEKERHKVITPVHDWHPPTLLTKTTRIGDMEKYHANDTDSTKKVEGMVTFFHFLPNKYSLKIGLTRRMLLTRQQPAMTMRARVTANTTSSRKLGW
jgi:hypothetical protein